MTGSRIQPKKIGYFPSLIPDRGKVLQDVCLALNIKLGKDRMVLSFLMREGDQEELFMPIPKGYENKTMQEIISLLEIRVKGAGLLQERSMFDIEQVCVLPEKEAIRLDQDWVEKLSEDWEWVADADVNVPFLSENDEDNRVMNMLQRGEEVADDVSVLTTLDASDHLQPIYFRVLYPNHHSKHQHFFFKNQSNLSDRMTCIEKHVGEKNKVNYYENEDKTWVDYQKIPAKNKATQQMLNALG